MGLSISKMCNKSSKKLKNMQRKVFRDKKVENIYKQISGNDPDEVYKDQYEQDLDYSIEI
mgnify:FL=1|jgi:hypothetical protein|uniref:Uncharacterized protein n=1 Tax=viral metagenome TaxID=1070528 RepID=A0A6C0IUD1_9ZZZZ